MNINELNQYYDVTNISMIILKQEQIGIIFEQFLSGDGVKQNKK